MILKVTGKNGEMIRVYCLNNGNYTNEWRHWNDLELKKHLENNRKKTDET